MKYLTLIRHAKSNWGDLSLSDHDRPLSERGLRAAPMVGGFLADNYLGKNGTPALLPQPDHLLSSTALRAKTTAELMHPKLGLDDSFLTFDERVYHALPKTLLQIVREQEDAFKHLMLFGHNPGLSEFVDKMICRGGMEEMPTCAAALLELPWDVWAAADWNEARLLGFVTPRMIEKRLGMNEESTYF